MPSIPTACFNFNDITVQLNTTKVWNWMGIELGPSLALPCYWTKKFVSPTPSRAAATTLKWHKGSQICQALCPLFSSIVSFFQLNHRFHCQLCLAQSNLSPILNSQAPSLQMTFPEFLLRWAHLSILKIIWILASTHLFSTFFYSQSWSTYPIFWIHISPNHILF